MTQIIGPDGKPFYLPPSTEAKRSWELARQAARLENNIAHVEQSIRRSNQPFRPPGSTGQTVAPNGTVTTHYGPSGSVTRSPSGRTTYQPGTASPWRSPTQPNPGRRNAATLRKPATYAPTATMERPPQSVPIRQRGVPRPLQSIPKAGRVAPAARAAGGAAARGAIGAGVASGVLSGAAVALSGGTLGQSVGAAVGGTAGTVAGAALGAAIGSIVPGPGTAAGAWVGGAIGGWAGAGVGQWAGGLLDPPEDIPSEGLTNQTQAQYAPLPFEGGQMAGVQYRVTLDIGRGRNPNNFPNLIRSVDVWGPVLGAVLKEPHLTNPDWGDRVDVAAHTSAGVRKDYKVADADTTANETYGPISVVSVVRTDGQPDTGGNLPQELIQGAAPRVPISIPPVGLANLPAPVPSKIGYSPPSALAPRGVPDGEQPPTLAPTETPEPTISTPASVPGITPQRYTDPSRTDTRVNPDEGTQERAPVTAASEANTDPAQRQTEQVVSQLAGSAALGATISTPQSIDQAWSKGSDKEKAEQEKQANWAPVPIPLGRPAGAPRAGDYPKPKGAPRGAVKLRPGGATGTQVKTPEPPKPPPPPKTGNPCGCNVPLLKNQSLINQKLDGLTSGAGLAAEAVSLKAIMDKLNAMQAFAAKAWEMTRIQKVLDVLTFVAVMHNVALLSRDVGETFGWVAGQALNVVGIEDEEGNTIDVYGWFTNGIQSLLVSLFGQELYDDARETWLKASSIVRSASAIIWTMRGIMDATQDLLEWVAEHTGRIGNALKAFGVVGERAYPWMSENAKTRNRVRARISKVTGTLENAEDMASSFAMATGNILEIQDETGELVNQFGDFKNTVIEGIPDPWDDNNPVKNDFELSKTNSQSTDINATDSARGS